MYTVLLDRDGVINRKMPEGRYVTRWEEFEFLPRAVEALGLLKAHGARLIVVTNQRGVARGDLTEEALCVIHERMQAALAAHAAALDAIYYCPHEEGTCDCRKPRTGLFRRAAADFPDIAFTRSVIVGDALSDLEAAHRLRAKAVLISDASPSSHDPHGAVHAVTSLHEAGVSWILPWLQGFWPHHPAD